jgi:RHS repeat-associated protein
VPDRIRSLVQLLVTADHPRRQEHEQLGTLGVFTVNGARTPTSWYFNVLAGERVVGRQRNAGSRRYYHADLLGSTRSVVEDTTVVESYDFEPWGLLMPGRTLAGPTKEGFTGKEQDAETGLDYFGARYYMPALARWTAVDPLAEKHLEWSPYNYVLNNPLVLIDPDGRQVSANDPARFFVRGPVRPGVFGGLAARAITRDVGSRVEPAGAFTLLNSTVSVKVNDDGTGYQQIEISNEAVVRELVLVGASLDLKAKVWDLSDKLPPGTLNYGQNRHLGFNVGRDGVTVSLGFAVGGSKLSVNVPVPEGNGDASPPGIVVRPDATAVGAVPNNVIPPKPPAPQPPTNSLRRQRKDELPYPDQH